MISMISAIQMEAQSKETTPKTPTTTNMADDTRNSATKEDLSREALTVDPTQKAFTGAQWQDGKAQGYQPPQNANLMPGGTENTAGGQTKEIGVGDALESIKLEEFTEIHKKPCVRDALMTGIGSGFGVGGVRALAGGMSYRN
jgi:cytochrome c oxidase assembly protein subunit 20